MNRYIKINIIIIFSFLCATSIAANRFIIKYKLSDANMYTGATYEKDISANKIRNHSTKKLSDEEIMLLSKKAARAGNKANKVTESHSMITGAVVIILNNDLDKNQTKNFIDSVREDNSVEYIEEDRVVRIAHMVKTADIH